MAPSNLSSSQRAIRVYETHEEINATIHPQSPNDESVFHNIDPFAAELSDQTVVTYPIHGIPQDAKIIKVVLGGIVGNTTSMRLTNRPRPGFFPDNALACTTPDSVARHVNAAFRPDAPWHTGWRHQGISQTPLAEGGDEHMTEAQGTDVTDPPTPFSNPDAPGHDHAPPTKKAKGQKTNAADDAEVAGPPRKLTSPSPPLSFSVPVTYPPPDHLDFHDIEEVRRASEAYMHSDWRNIEAEDKPNWLVKLEVILQLALINKEDHDDPELGNDWSSFLQTAALKGNWILLGSHL
eukprot:gene2240-biopygen13137